MYQQELTRSGEALFKIRGKYLKLLVIISVAIAYFNGALGPFASDFANQMWFLASLAVAWSGAIVRFFTSGYAALGTSGVNKVAAIASELNTTGPYSLVRNPLYLGRILNFTGIAMLSGSLVFSVLIFFVSVLVYERISIYEEEFLYKEFGKEAHAEWAKDVPFLMPRFHGWKKPKYPFWVRRCIKREEKKVMYLVTAIAMTIFARTGFDFSQFPDGSVWYYIWIVVILAYMVSRGLRRFTKTYDGIS
jgi:protein-S-isoprenylcysteine O-methyltransferase Ste14